MEPLVTLADLIARCDWTFDEDEERAAPGYIEEASDLVRSYGRLNWEPDACPRMAKNIVISAVRRFMRNPEGYTVSRAGDETLEWSDQKSQAATIYLTASEQKILKGLAGGGGIRTAGMSAWGPHTKLAAGETYSVPVSGWPYEKPFPYFNDPTEPW